MGGMGDRWVTVATLRVEVIILAESEEGERRSRGQPSGGRKSRWGWGPGHHADSCPEGGNSFQTGHLRTGRWWGVLSKDGRPMASRSIWWDGSGYLGFPLPLPLPQPRLPHTVAKHHFSQPAGFPKC